MVEKYNTFGKKTSLACRTRIGGSEQETSLSLIMLFLLYCPFSPVETPFMSLIMRHIKIITSEISLPSNHKSEETMSSSVL